MIHKRKFSFVALLLGALALGAVIGSGCAIHRGDRSIVQPLALNKAQFKGTWYYQRTVIKAPYDAVGVFPGSTDNGYKVRFEISERYLYAFTTQPNVRNADSTVAPVAAWPIIGHFTVRYMISYATGQPSNIVGEDYRNKPWYQRPHFRVAWGRSAITDFTSYAWLYQMFGWSSTFTERASNVRPEQVRIMSKYMDFVAEEIVTPGFRAVIGKLNRGLPATSFRVKYRYAFKRVEEKPTYTPRTMTDDQFQKFGFFRTAILKYNLDRGLVDWSYQYLANRHNVANKAEIAAGSKKPKQIKYYLSPNFPEEYLTTAHQIIAEWNKAFQRATNRTDDVVVLLPNDHLLPKGQKREMGDIRYRFLYWVPEAISFGLLGYGPSFADYDTGEIISSAAYVYGATVKRVASRFMLLYDMVKGTYTDEELRNGKDYLDIINKYTKNGGAVAKPLTMVKGHGIMAPKYQGFDLKKAHAFMKSPSLELANTKVRHLTRSAIQARMSIIDKHPALKWAMIPDEYLQSLYPSVDVIGLRALDAQSGNKILNEFLHPANLMRANNLRKLMDEGSQFGQHNMLAANYIDPAMSKFVEANKHLSRSELMSKMSKIIFLGTEAHEIGHTFGLRHNFEGSADEKNYFPKYFELKARQGGNIPGSDKHKEHRWFYMYSSIMDYHGEVYGDGQGIGTYDHAAIMYGYGNILELDAKNGVASIDALNSYLNKVKEKASSDKQYAGIYSKIEVTQNKLKLEERPSFDGKKKVKVFDTLQTLLHVQGVRTVGGKTVKETIIKLTGDNITGHQALRLVHAKYGVAPAKTRFYADGSPFIQDAIIPLHRRLYRFCSDDLVGQTPYCARFDSGFSPKSMVENMIRRYDGTYPLRNWNRGRRYYRLSGGYLYSMISRFSIVSLFYQNWMYRAINESGFAGTPEYFDQLAAIQRGVKFVSRVIHTPEPGRHILSTATNSYVSSAKASSDTLSMPIGVGRYFYSKLQDDELGYAQYRFKRIGIMYDKYVALMTLAIRDWGLAQNSVNFFLINFADYFSKDDVTELFTEAIGGQFTPKYAYSYKSKMIAPNWHPVLQYASMYMAMSMLNNFIYGNTFSHYMTVGIRGNKQSWDPPPGKENKVISFQNTSGTRSYFAVQTEDGRSISYKLIERGKLLADKIKELRALPTSATNIAELQEKEGKLVFLETTLLQMSSYVNAFFE